MGRVEFAELVHFGKELVSAFRFGFVNFLKSETDVDEDIIAEAHLRRVFEADLLDDAAEIGFAHPDAMSVGLDFENFSGDG